MKNTLNSENCMNIPVIMYVFFHLKFETSMLPYSFNRFR